MDYGKLSVEEIRSGSRFDEETQAFVCNYCGRRFPEGEAFPIGDRLFTSARAIEEHIAIEHDGAFSQLIESGEKYNTFTDTQKELLRLFEEGLSDSEISKRLGIAASTVRHQKFTFREKAKQAKHYLAVYDEVFDSTGSTRKADDIVSIPNSATMMDERYVMTEKEKQRILKTDFESLKPLRLKGYPLKAKRQVAVLSRIAEEFEFGKTYTDQETRDIISPVYEDYNLIRRYLVDYGFLGRTKDGAKYWLR